MNISGDAMNSIQDLVSTLGSRVDTVTVSLLPSHWWLVGIEKDGKHKEFAAARLDCALQEAIDYKWLPLVPKRPQRHEYTVQKRYNGEYEILRNGHWMMRTDKNWKVEKYIKKRIGRDAIAIQEWNRQYAWTLTKQEGVDFEYKR